MAGSVGPEYQRLIDRLRADITSGEYPVGQTIPSTSALAKLTGVSAQVVRRAVGQLQADGILEGHPGKGVFVKAMPEEADQESRDVASLSRQVSELEERFGDLASHPGGASDADLAEVRADIASLQEAQGRLEVNLIDLYGKMGYDYPQGGAQHSTKAAVRGGRAR
jgi:DNA-binding FadR family transcriptional regulator